MKRPHKDKFYACLPDRQAQRNKSLTYGTEANYIAAAGSLSDRMVQAGIQPLKDNSSGMKKVLLAFSGSDFSKGAFEFARQLNKVNPILLTGFFLPELSHPGFEGVHATNYDEDEIIVTNNINHFARLCEINNIQYRLHSGTYELWTPQLIKESRFSDLLIAGSEVFLESGYEAGGYYLDKILHRAECPVVVVPEDFDFPENVVLAYDGSPSSVFAIKQFTYLFPELCNMSTILVYATRKAAEEIPERSKLEELVGRHYTNLRYFRLDADPQIYFNAWLTDRKNTLLVTGACGRTELSELFNKSFVKETIAEYRMPVFITHY